MQQFRAKESDTFYKVKSSRLTTAMTEPLRYEVCEEGTYRFSTDQFIHR